MSENLDSRIWVDGCFDFFHHGHAGALMQARQHGDELYVGVHSDAEIERNKGPVVMRLEERKLAVLANKWSSKVVPDAPYVTDPKVMDEFRAQYVVHGDDITTDANGNDSYQTVKDLGRFITVKRTPNISTTDLIQRMLGSERVHHLDTLTTSPDSNPTLLSEASVERLTAYSTDETAKNPHTLVLAVLETADPAKYELKQVVAPSSNNKQELATSAFYVPGTFDLLHSGHYEFLQDVKKQAHEQGAAVVIGLYDDATANKLAGENYPIMNNYERALSLLQTRYVDGLVLGARLHIDGAYLDSLTAAGVHVTRIYHGPTPIPGSASASNVDNLAWARDHDLVHSVPGGKFGSLSALTIIARVLDDRARYEERQRKKGVKSQNEKLLRQAEIEAATAAQTT